MAHASLLPKARAFVRKWFAERIPAHLTFHDLEHTLAVTRTALAIGRASGLGAHDLRLVELAALFHDTGYARKAKGHEKESARIASTFLARHGVSAVDQLRIRALIMATRPSVSPRGPLQAVLRDADQAKAGQPDFLDKSERLREELSHRLPKPPTAKAWLNANIAYLEGHRFHTRYAQRRFGMQKAINLADLKQRRSGSREAARVQAVQERFIARDLSWLSFNERVLQEAENPKVPLFERVKFLGIHSSNLDEFYRVRVASLRSLAQLKRKQRKVIAEQPAKLVAALNHVAVGQQRRFGVVWRRTILPALSKQGIRLLGPQALSGKQLVFVERWFLQHAAPLIRSVPVRGGGASFMEDRKLYFTCRIKQGRKERQVLLNIPSSELGRFVELPSARGKRDLLFLDDVVRIGLPHLFPDQKVMACHSIKLSRDAELHLEEEYAENMVDKVRRSLKKRKTGVPARFLYDSEMPAGMLNALVRALRLVPADLVPGGRHHHMSDLLTLPLHGKAALRDTKHTPILPHALRGGRGLFQSARHRDVLLHFPYHDFAHIVDWLKRAAHDPAVKRIAVTLYRVADGSAVCAELLNALERGKKVTVFVEVQARFDEGSNLYWGARLEKAGATVLYSYANLKVHCKLLLIDRTEGGRNKRYAYLGTGNFNERSSRIYSDIALITSRPEITEEVAAVFRHLADRRTPLRTKRLLMAPDGLRPALETMIDDEARRARQGKASGILLKLNSLEDRALISKLYHASNAGVPVRIIVRGICCLVPGVPGLSANIEVISIVDRYLEHARAYVFHKDGDPLVYLSSADLMERNMDRRIECAFPIVDDALRREVLDVLGLQWRDNVKARVVDESLRNAMRKRPRSHAALRSQEQTYVLLKRRNR
ncbi:MAG: polyphosphate kinase 1 [Flavobacteriales bacterium]|nr:MAG: polyphosphate kinase 1 [Flavobacteriales bacterium]